jgi:transposase
MEEKEFKFNVDWTKSSFFCGMDVHKHELTVAIFSEDESKTEFLKTNVFQVNSQGLEQFWNFIKKYQPDAFAMEATGIFHHVIFNFLTRKREFVRWPFKIIVVNPADAAGLPGRPKFDKIDAINLAKYLSKGLLKNGKAIVQVLEDLKAIFRMAVGLERDRTALKNRIIKSLDRAGIRPRKLNLNNDWVVDLIRHFIENEKSLGEFLTNIFKNENLPLQKYRAKIVKNIAYFAPFFEFSLTHAQRVLIRQNLIELEFKTGRKSLLAIEIEHMIQAHPALRKHARNLATIPGISPFSAVWILAETGNIKQFPNHRNFTAYCGCCPRVVSSAGKVYSAHTSRHSNSYLRTIFLNAATVVCNLLKADSCLKQYANRIVKRKSHRSHKLAQCIVAAKISRIAYALLRDGVPFNPYYLEEFRGSNIENNEVQFTVADRKLIRRARNVLNRVREMDELGFLGERAEILAAGLDQLLQGKKVYMI